MTFDDYYKFLRILKSSFLWKKQITCSARVSALRMGEQKLCRFYGINENNFILLAESIITFKNQSFIIGVFEYITINKSHYTSYVSSCHLRLLLEITLQSASKTNHYILYSC